MRKLQYNPNNEKLQKDLQRLRDDIHKIGMVLLLFPCAISICLCHVMPALCVYLERSSETLLVCSVFQCVSSPPLRRHRLERTAK